MNKSTRIPKRLLSNRGMFMSAITYPILFSLVIFSISAFIATQNLTLQTKVHHNILQSQYNAIKGIEYAFIEVSEHQRFGTTSFITHKVGIINNELNPDDEVVLTTNLPNTDIDDTEGDNENTYRGSDGAGNLIFRVKVYSIPNLEGIPETYILAKGISGNHSKLFINKIAGTSLYEYFSFFPGNASMSWNTWDSKGSKIHINGDLQLGARVNISNISQLSTEGKMYYSARSFYKPEETKDGWWWLSRYPHAYPQGFGDGQGGDPPPPPENYMGSYVNVYYNDGNHYADQGQLYMWDGDSFEKWDTGPLLKSDPLCDDEGRGPGCIRGSFDPINPWVWDDTKTGFEIYDCEGEEGNLITIDWNSSKKDYWWIYQEAIMNCAPGTCAHDNPIANNSAFYVHTTKINNVFIPSRGRTLGSDNFKSINYYSGYDEPQRLIDPTDSELHEDVWRAFIEAFPTDLDDDPLKIEKLLKGVVKAGPNFGGKHIAPPRVMIDDFVTSAEGDGMTIEWSPGDNAIAIEINYIEGIEGKRVLLEEGETSEPVSCDVDIGDKPLFTQETFINHLTAKINKVVEVNMGNLMECDENSENNWLPKNGVISSKYGLSIANARTIPNGITDVRADGLTLVVDGDLILKGHFNYPDDPESATEGWAPAGAIVSERIFLVSNAFDYPEDLTTSFHHSNYPYGYSYDGGEYELPAGTGYDNDYIFDGGGGYNWFYEYDPDDNEKLYKMANHVRKCAINDDQCEASPWPGAANTYYYTISLIGKHAYEPSLLEIWNYYENPGDDISAPPSNYKEHVGFVIGAFVKLSDEFPIDGDPNNVVDPVNYRKCTDLLYLDIDDTGTVLGSYTPGNYPCREEPGNATTYNNWMMDKKYEIKYVTSNIRPPGDLMGLFQSVLLELEPKYWTQHDPDLG